MKGADLGDIAFFPLFSFLGYETLAIRLLLFFYHFRSWSQWVGGGGGWRDRQENLEMGPRNGSFLSFY